MVQLLNIGQHCTGCPWSMSHVFATLDMYVSHKIIHKDYKQDTHTVTAWRKIILAKPKRYRVEKARPLESEDHIIY